jgi:hypothetical protein
VEQCTRAGLERICNPGRRADTFVLVAVAGRLPEKRGSEGEPTLGGFVAHSDAPCRDELVDHGPLHERNEA